MLKLEYRDYTLDFKFEAGTSRGILKDHPIVLLKIYDSEHSEVYGLGEAAPLHNLSPEKVEDVKEALAALSPKLKSIPMPDSEEEVFGLVSRLVLPTLPSLRMALETAFLDLINGGRRLIFNNDFYRGISAIPINGLIWMGAEDAMREQIAGKLSAGFKCIKMKIGAIDFEQELSLLRFLRAHDPDLIIRVDANGAFATDEVFSRLSQLEELGIHSIEQPIMAGQHEAMQLLCKRSPVPIALDEELIGVNEYSQKQELLKFIRPQYIILKPTLLGGFGATLEWISLAEQQGIGWWLTSALESNISLNAIAQFAGRFPSVGYQGLGTGQLYHNNIDSPLEIAGAFLGYNQERTWMNVF
ncbi:o-succinylbenzoate synthase [Marinoscillum sp. 108]|uniref:o-succinylbenzoate synthase n=1 Tax=Marinoscillum sp. 108 TaxID=2653151 RepID=UPI0012EFC5A8|nr:o-succinylbenzoate synthase [Marinoscillum sp. 108]VXD15837.1 O-succinylbenzoate synthase [Marinoscillum sp. 108]